MSYVRSLGEDRLSGRKDSRDWTFKQKPQLQITHKSNVGKPTDTWSYEPPNPTHIKHTSLTSHLSTVRSLRSPRYVRTTPFVRRADSPEGLSSGPLCHRKAVSRNPTHPSRRRPKQTPYRLGKETPVDTKFQTRPTTT